MNQPSVFVIQAWLVLLVMVLVVDTRRANTVSPYDFYRLRDSFVSLWKRQAVRFRTVLIDVGTVDAL